MSRVFILEFEENGKAKCGLFYENVKRVRHNLTEDFKPLVFDTENEAQEKLGFIEEERRSEDSAVPFTLEETKSFVESHKWKYATTYAKTAPHEYLVKKWLSQEDRLLFERLVQTINKNSVIGYFYSHKNNYLILDDYYYWYMDYPENFAVDLINRTTTDYLEYRNGAIITKKGVYVYNLGHLAH